MSEPSPNPKAVFINAPFDRTATGMITALLDAFQSPPLDASALRGALLDLHLWAMRAKRNVRATTIFYPHLFSGLFNAATKLAADYGLLAP